MFTRRFNDLVIQSAAVQLLLDRDRVHHFTGWSYGHNSGGDRPSDGRLYMGIFQVGLDAGGLPAQREELHRLLDLLRGKRMGRALRSPAAAYVNMTTINHGALTLARPGVCTRLHGARMDAAAGTCRCDHLLPTHRDPHHRRSRRGNPARQWVLC